MSRNLYTLCSAIDMPVTRRQMKKYAAGRGVARQVERLIDNGANESEIRSLLPTPYKPHLTKKDR